MIPHSGMRHPVPVMMCTARKTQGGLDEANDYSDRRPPDSDRVHGDATWTHGNHLMIILIGVLLILIGFMVTRLGLMEIIFG